jgi:hypothetical protein
MQEEVVDRSTVGRFLLAETRMASTIALVDTRNLAERRAAQLASGDRGNIIAPIASLACVLALLLGLAFAGSPNPSTPAQIDANLTAMYGP